MQLNALDWIIALLAVGVCFAPALALTADALAGTASSAMPALRLPMIRAPWEVEE